MSITSNSQLKKRLYEMLASFHTSRIPLPPTSKTPISAKSNDIVFTYLDLESVSETGLSDRTGQHVTLDTPLKFN